MPTESTSLPGEESSLKTPRNEASVLVIGVGGLGCPALWALAGTGLRLVLVDDDVVDESNLHRQVLFEPSDVGRPKLEAARDALLKLGVAPEFIQLEPTRFLPENALSLCRSVDVIVEGSDNYATKFLAADAARLAERPVIHGAALGWNATAWAVSAQGLPCYRCLFEDLPVGETQNCSTSGVVGPVVGFAGALLADLCLRVLSAEAPYGSVFSYDGKRDQLRETLVSARADCPLCGIGNAVTAPIAQLTEERYLRPICAA